MPTVTAPKTQNVQDFVKTYNKANPSQQVTVDQVRAANKLGPNDKIAKGLNVVIPDSFTAAPTRGPVDLSGASTTTTTQAATSANSVNTSSAFQGPDDIVLPPMPSSKGLDLKDPNVMAKYQEEMQQYTQLVQLRSKLAEMLHDARKGIVSAMRA